MAQLKVLFAEWNIDMIAFGRLIPDNSPRSGCHSMQIFYAIPTRLWAWHRAKYWWCDNEKHRN